MRYVQVGQKYWRQNRRATLKDTICHNSRNIQTCAEHENLQQMEQKSFCEAQTSPVVQAIPHSSSCFDIFFMHIQWFTKAHIQYH